MKAIDAPLVDQRARDRFRDEWNANFAVSANAGSGKTTAISERLAAMALAPEGAALLRKTAVVTYTKKAAAQIEQRARQVLLRRITESPGLEGVPKDLSPLDHLERAFFGTIHSFCLKLAQTYGQTVGINLNPTVVAEDDEALWEEFIEQDPMEFGRLSAVELNAFLRHVPLEKIFDVARTLDAERAAGLGQRQPSGLPPAPSEAVLADLLALPAKGSGSKNVTLSQQRAQVWQEKWTRGAGFLPLYENEGKSAALVELAQTWMAPLKRWLGDAAGVLAAELAGRYRAWRFTRGVQTYADQIDAALAVLNNDALLNRVRSEGWRIILDEAQDTDPQQFAVLVELARPPDAARNTWPRADGRGVGPRPGHFCMVGDGQQAIYSTRADIGNFSRHVDAFRRGDGGEFLEFQVTFRAPHAVISLLNTTLPDAFGKKREDNFGLPPAEGAPPPFLQVPYVPLEPGPVNQPGVVGRIELLVPAHKPAGVESWLTEEARQVALWLKQHGPGSVGATKWGDIAVLAPRNDWLSTAQKAFEGVGLQVALQTRRNRSGDHPVYAWLTGLLAVCADPENTFEWVGVLREVFGVSDALIASELRQHGRLAWDEPDQHSTPLAEALAKIRPFVLRVNDEGRALQTFARELAAAAALAERARARDASGGLENELERLLAQAAERGLQGASPREWLAELLAHIDDGRPAGKPTDDAINFLSAHSAKGLEWPVVIVLGLWRGIGKFRDSGLELVRDARGKAQVFLDQASLPPEAQESLERERVRELTRLLYVTLTRARRGLVIPWSPEFGGRQKIRPSFAELWGTELSEISTLTAAPGVEPPAISATAVSARPAPGRASAAAILSVTASLPARLLPHQLAHARDAVRQARHESGVDEPRMLDGVNDPIQYGLWWHETMELLPWAENDLAIAAHGERALQEAETLGFRVRGEEEWTRLQSSAAWPVLRDTRWTRLAEIGIFAPLRSEAWIDGVIDLVLHDATAGELWVVDWKTNQRRLGETDETLLGRLGAEYTPQLAAYGECLAGFFPACRVRRLVFSSVAGAWRDTDGQKF
ncbi:MAG: UvrD-helicase domain-containing protein [Opitutaceae bacterium]